jgi:glycerate kinase
MVAALDRGLQRLAEVIRRDLGLEVEELPGAGAAGGLGAGLVAFVGGRLRPGAEMVMEALHLDARLQGADLVLTGEGWIDGQTTRFGKGPAAVARHARAAGIPVIAIGGGISDEAELRQIFDGLESLVGGSITTEEAIARVRPLLAQATERALTKFR